MTSLASQAAAPTGGDLEMHSYSGLLLAESMQEGLRKGARTELKLRWAACELLESRSPADVRVADLCALVEVAQGTFYQYFADRNALLGSLLEGFVRYLAGNMAAAAKGGRSHQDATRISTRTYCLLFEQNRGLMKCLLNHYDSFPQARGILQDFNRGWIETVVDSIQRRRGKRRAGMASREELLRRCYALGGMVDQYLSYIFLAEDGNVASIAGDIDAIAGTLDHIWWQALRQELAA
jgi:TetR/AcrR family transcriptional regulator, ethionamide resistance regulator